MFTWKATNNSSVYVAVLSIAFFAYDTCSSREMQNLEPEQDGLDYMDAIFR